MTDKPENPPAYPFVLPTKYRIAEAGMTLRDWFAGQALVGMMPHEDMPWCAAHAKIDAKTIAGAAYELADAMLQQRNS